MQKNPTEQLTDTYIMKDKNEKQVMLRGGNFQEGRVKEGRR
jgi:hypothetical protein